MERRFPKVRVRRRSPNQSSRIGDGIQLIVLHSTQGVNLRGLADLIGLAGWFGTSRNQVSSHAADDAEGQSARFVSDEAKAWHCMDFNSVALGLEQIGKAEQTSWTPEQIDESARWLAYWSRKHKIPLQRAHVRDGRVLVPGVATHEQLGAAGGSHHDPGHGFPVNRCIRRARHFRALQAKK